MQSTSLVRCAQSSAPDPVEAAREFHAAVRQDDMELVLFFCSSDYDLDLLAAEMNRLFPGVRVIGCTTAGEIGPAGYLTHGLSGVSFPKSGFAIEVGFIDNVQSFEFEQGRSLTFSVMQRLEARPSLGPHPSQFAFLLIDGLSMREEWVARALQNALGKIPLVGGSAGDDLKFRETALFHNGRFHLNAALMMLVSTPYAVTTFKTQHFVPSTKRLVVTSVDTARRVVKEINGRPAASEYARLTGVEASELCPAHFAAHPVLVIIDGTGYVRSIQTANADDTLTFYCAIDEGLVLRLADRLDLIDSLTQAFDELEQDIGSPQLVLGCDCILRNLEITQRDLKSTVGDILNRNHTGGFSTYGEQYRGVHVNQTFTGIAIGSRRGADHV